MTAELIHGCCLEVLAAMKAAGRTVDAVVCDPPYEIGMMNKHWDRTGIAFRPETWRLAYDLLPPGGHMAVFGGSRTHHRMACAIEDAGFELFDCLLWLHGQGFPKAKTQLKPAYEPIILARKPAKGPLRPLNIDACRVATDENLNGGAYSGSLRRRAEYSSTDQAEGAVALSRLNRGSGEYEQPAGRWPPNILHSGDPEVLAAFARFGERKNGGQNYLGGDRESMFGNKAVVSPTRYAGDTGSAARFFPALGYDEDELRFCYAAKASKSERAGSAHPCIKPLALMRWICRLITPPNGTILDPFAGSGSTLRAALDEGFHAVGIERELEYIMDARLRLGLELEAADYATKRSLAR